MFLLLLAQTHKRWILTLLLAQGSRIAGFVPHVLAEDKLFLRNSSEATKCMLKSNMQYTVGGSSCHTVSTKACLSTCISVQIW